jgi:hypothetical protein
LLRGLAITFDLALRIDAPVTVRMVHLFIPLHLCVSALDDALIFEGVGHRPAPRLQLLITGAKQRRFVALVM